MSENDDIFGDTKLTKKHRLTGSAKKKDIAPALLVLQGPANSVGSFWLLTDPEYSLGRSPDNSIFIDDQSVSRSHALLQVSENQVLIEDLGSSNKTIINGITLKAKSPYSLKNNDQVSCGDVLFKFLARNNLETEALIKMQERISSKK